MMLKQNQDLFCERLSLIRKQVDKKPELNENKQEKVQQKRKTLLVKSLNPSMTMVYNNV